MSKKITLEICERGGKYCIREKGLFFWWYWNPMFEGFWFYPGEFGWYNEYMAHVHYNEILNAYEAYEKFKKDKIKVYKTNE